MNKINKSDIRRAMALNPDTSYRPEQIRAAKILQLFFPLGNFEMEKVIRGLQRPDLRMAKLGCVADISMQYSCKRCRKPLEVIFRLQGKSHRLSDKVQDKDKRQRRILEHNKKLVIDFWYDIQVHLWAGDDLDLTVEEIGQAVEILL